MFAESQSRFKEECIFNLAGRKQEITFYTSLWGG
jgi:hypothetical protein